jgi:phospholipase D1/2
MASEMSREGGEEVPPTSVNNSSFATTTQHDEDPAKPRRPAKGSEPFEKWERDEMEKLLGQLNGQLGLWHVSLDAYWVNLNITLVLYSNRFLEGEDSANNFLFTADR